ncbi:hypothetical protein F5Y15DRAFT_406881 [Xylariaceae sp. FL0016]|nr:hypothetical protein F5Y15DRAFT_406881 [Xylariaceae sp. FL0016]
MAPATFQIVRVVDARLFAFFVLAGREQLRKYCVIFFLFSNHEATHSTRDVAKARLVLLEQTRHDVSDGLTVLGRTLSSHAPDERASAVSNRLIDFTSIGNWIIAHHSKSHDSDLACFNGQRQIAIFTHHSPTVDPRANDPVREGGEVKSGFITDLSSQICWTNVNIMLWALGHTHLNCKLVDEIGKRIAMDQRGCHLALQNDFSIRKTAKSNMEQRYKATGIHCAIRIV